MKFNFCADNGVTLHDCEITEWISGEDITMVFEDGFDVFADCPQNDTGRHKRTGKSAVILKNGGFVSGEISLENNEANPVCQEELAELELEVLDFKVLPDSVILECDAWKDGKDAGFCEMEFSCTKVVYCWNEFSGDAWFQK